MKIGKLLALVAIIGLIFFVPEQVLGMNIHLLPGFEFLTEHFLGLGNDGVVNPEMYYMRYRADEYDPNSPFFQWWYYVIKNGCEDIYFALAINQVICPKVPEGRPDYSGTYTMFTMVEKVQKTGFHQYNRCNINDMVVNNVTESGEKGLTIKVLSNGMKGSIDFLNDHTYRFTGEMGCDAKWLAEGTLKGLPIDPEKGARVAWNLTFSRLYGWYGQQDMEEKLNTAKIISWNTYAHTATVEGWIEVDGERYFFNKDSVYYDQLTKVERPKYRAYGDMNWGSNFPEGKPEVEFFWGWYYVGLPNTDCQREIGIIAGIGRTDTKSPVGICEGQFADICLPEGDRLGIRNGIILKRGPQKPGIVLADSSSDSNSPQGDVLRFEVEQSEWGEFTDSFGTSVIPYRQIVHIETKHRRITLDFQSRPENYNRLLFPHQDYLFSDFEGLGVLCQVKIEQKIYYWWQIEDNRPIYQTQYEFSSNDAGVQYGYKAPIRVT